MSEKRVIIVEDDPLFGEDLKMFLEREIDVSLYENPDALAEAAQADSFSFEGVELLVLDYKFDNYNAWNKDIVTYIKELGYQGKIILWSLEERFSKPFLKQVDGVMPKRLFSLAEATQCLENYAG